jgi:hypothetical protein
MRCEGCHGGAVRVTSVPLAFPGLLGALQVSADGTAIELTCPECNGSGIAHCCDWICAQPQTESS